MLNHGGAAALASAQAVNACRRVRSSAAAPVAEPCALVAPACNAWRQRLRPCHTEFADARVGNAGGVVNDHVRYRDLIADSARWEGFPFRADDIIINTPSKSGTTWMQTLCAMLVFDSIEFGRPLTEISPSLEMQINNRAEVIASLQAQEHRRFIKSHTPLDGVPVAEGVTYVCVTRPPRCRAFVPASPGKP